MAHNRFLALALVLALVLVLVHPLLACRWRLASTARSWQPSRPSLAPSQPAAVKWVINILYKATRKSDK